MKNFNLSLIILICGSFLFMPNCSHANTTSSIAKPLSNLNKTVPEDDIDPDWIIFRGHFKTDIDRTQL